MFTGCVDDAAAYENASTRFTDDGEFGLGYEVEISTYKYMIHGMSSGNFYENEQIEFNLQKQKESFKMRSITNKKAG